MSVISLSFIIFSALSVAVYFVLPLRARPWWLLISSLFFYATFDLSYFFFLGFSVLSTYAASHLISRAQRLDKPRITKLTAATAIILNAGLLVTVKFLGYSVSLLEKLLDTTMPTFSLPAALGISFYTMQAISYCTDVYKGKYPPEKNLAKYTLYMTYFPIIMQGPISRYDKLADQLFIPHRFSFERMKNGASLVLWGAFKKLVIADRAALLVNHVFGDSPSYGGFAVITAVLLYTFQIYTDFSGFTDISRGISYVYGIELTNNFDHPYFADSIKDFWRRWHLSLSSWLRDYVYIPLGGSRKGTLRKYINILVVFFISGLWHGVGVHYIVWGLLQGIFQIIGELTSEIKNKIYTACRINRESFSFGFGKRIITFVLVNISWLFFRANGFLSALDMLRAAVTKIDLAFFFDGSLFNMGLDRKNWIILIISLGILWMVSSMQKRFSIREKLNEQAFWFRYPIYIVSILAVIVLGVYGPGFSESQFIYMQF